MAISKLETLLPAYEQHSVERPDAITQEVQKEIALIRRARKDLETSNTGGLIGFLKHLRQQALAMGLIAALKDNTALTYWESQAAMLEELIQDLSSHKEVT